MPKSWVDDLNLEAMGNVNATHTYSLTLAHLARVKEMKLALKDAGVKVSEGGIVRRAIDLLAEQFDPELFVEQDVYLDMRSHPAFVTSMDAARGVLPSFMKRTGSLSGAPRRSIHEGTRRE